MRNHSSAVSVLVQFFCMLLAMTVLAASAGAEEGGSWEERLAQARKKYNEKTVNVYKRGRGKTVRGKINVCFYPSDNKPYISINIRESLQITDQAEMEAILEVVVQNENYSEEEYGTISFMKAQWIAHNIAHSMATGSETQKKLVEAIAGESIRDVAGRAKQLDLSAYGEISAKNRMLYEIIELVYCSGQAQHAQP